MGFGAMITNNAVGHPAEKHAHLTASKLVIDPLPKDDPSGEKRAAAIVLRVRAVGMLTRYHEIIADDASVDIAALANAACDDFLKLTEGTILESHFHDPLVRDAIKRELETEFATQQYVCQQK